MGHGDGEGKSLQARGVGWGANSKQRDQGEIKRDQSHAGCWVGRRVHSKEGLVAPGQDFEFHSEGSKKPSAGSKQRAGTIRHTFKFHFPINLASIHQY